MREASAFKISPSWDFSITEITASRLVKMARHPGFLHWRTRSLEGYSGSGLVRINGCSEILLKTTPRKPAIGAVRLLPFWLYANELLPVHAIDCDVEQAIREALRRGDKGIRKIAREMGVGVSVVQRVKMEVAAV